MRSLPVDDFDSTMSCTAPRPGLTRNTRRFANIFQLGAEKPD